MLRVDTKHKTVGYFVCAQLHEQSFSEAGAANERKGPCMTLDSYEQVAFELACVLAYIQKISFWRGDKSCLCGMRAVLYGAGLASEVLADGRKDAHHRITVLSLLQLRLHVYDSFQ